MYKKIFLGIITAIFLSYNILAQYSPMHNYTSSPNTASLGSYGDIPVSLYSGLANINIPLYEISEGDLKVPVSLSYNSSGIRVEEEASWVGLGWNLDCGGVITRTIQGLDDMKSTYIWLGTSVNESLGYPFDDFNPSNYNDYKEICEKKIDGEPDIFIFNICGISGKFIFPQGQDFYSNYIEGKCLNDLETVVRYIKDKETFEIITSDGCKYYLGTPEVTESQYGASSTSWSINMRFRNYDDIAITGWYLDSIRSVKGDKVKFEYDLDVDYSENFYSPYGSSSVLHLVDQIDQVTLQYSASGGSASCYPRPYDVSYSASMSFMSNLYLKSVSWSSGSISFEKSNRIDIRSVGENNLNSSYWVSNSSLSPQKLDRMVIKNNNNELIKSFDFINSYFNNYYTGTDAYLYKRLKLDAVIEKGKNQSDNGNKYTIDYIETIPLPSKESFGRDFWGFYNGADNNTSLVPPGTYKNVLNTVFTVGTADRFPNAAYMKAGMIKSIKYPTGGKTNFYFEPNDYSDYGSGNDYTNYSIPKKITYSAQAAYDNEEGYIITLDKSTLVTLSEYIEFIEMSRNSQITNPFSDYGFTEYDKYGYLVKLGNNDDPDFDECSSTCSSSSYCKSFILGNWTHRSDLNSSTYEVTYPSFTLGAGRYKLIVKGYNYMSVRLKLSYDAPDVVGTNQINENGVIGKIGGGLRIARIENIDNNNHKNVRTYKYSDYDNSSEPKVSSGKLMMFPSHHSLWNHSEFEMGDASCSINYDAFRGTAWSNIPTIHATNGSIIGYSEVWEIIGENKEGGSVHSVYNNMIDFQSQGLFIEGFPNVSHPNNGELICTSYYNSNDKIVKSDSYYREIYKWENHKGVKSTSFVSISQEIGGSPIYEPCAAVIYKDYELLQYISKVSYQTTRLFEPANEHELSNTVKTYTYNNKIQVASENIVNSDGTSYTTHYLYPPDYANGQASFINDMNSKNIIGIPIEQYTVKTINDIPYVIAGKLSKYYDGSMVGLPYKEYNLISNSNLILNNTFKPSNIVGFDKSWYYQKVIYDNYDSKKNLLQFHENNNVNVSYIWGYGNSLPIAEIKNASQGQIAYTSFEGNYPDDYPTGWSLPGDFVNYDGVNWSFTGHNCFDGGSGNVIQSPPLKAGKYIVSFWAKGNPGSSYVTVNGANAVNPDDTKGGIYETKVTLLTDQSKISIGVSNITIDEIRIYPVDAQMTTFTYDPLIGLTSTTDPSGRSVYYEYDNYGRLYIVRDQDKNILQKNNYNYAP